MKTALKIAISLLLSGFVGFYIQTVLLITTNPAHWTGMALSLACAGWVGWCTWKLLSGRQISVSAAVSAGALIFGAFGFVFGFFGPMLITVGSGETAFTGIVAASTLGLLIGAAGGFFYASGQKRG
ncbi:hypothetical protein SAMN05421690_10499 [Nitrosomonas sp. Nm51]|uniref:hypothetical protein n=1 Tax=Nitrosomonas sp. Nm51 TaxID=133720 RepID=UPI0008C01753|nr:hypothetical protein [Nitrosomonas sp. Nm51]SER65659.1 hypothetical protein SAMN05421690_10499 [Nitrosomonas sp. Nm51]